ncbi:MAG TPA: hypothetical protein VGP72_02635 [Planctomycetota bacterium]|jgi:hypothetical protein
MRRINSDEPNRLSYRSGGGCMALFGLPFFGFGLFAMTTAFSGIWNGGAPSARVPVFLFGLVFGAVGSAFVFGRSGVILDKGLKTVTRWYGLLFPMWTKVQELDTFEEVHMSREERGSGSGRYTAYPVQLKGSAGAKLEIAEPRTEGESRKFAEEVAKFADLPIVDLSSGIEVRREAGHLDESLREQLARTGQEVDITTPPADMRATFSAEGNAVHFEIPPPPLGCVPVVALVAAIGFSCFVLFTFVPALLSFNGMPAGVQWIFGAFIGIGFVLLPVGGALLALLSRRNRRGVVEADPECLRVSHKGLLLWKRVEIPAGKLEELRIEQPIHGKNSAPQLAAISDEKTARFGEGLSHEELEWIRRVILKAVTSQ